MRIHGYPSSELFNRKIFRTYTQQKLGYFSPFIPQALTSSFLVLQQGLAIYISIMVQYVNSKLLRTTIIEERIHCWNQNNKGRQRLIDLGRKRGGWGKWMGRLHLQYTTWTVVYRTDLNSELIHTSCNVTCPIIGPCTFLCYIRVLESLKYLILTLMA